MEKFHLNEVSKWGWQLLTNGSFVSPAAAAHRPPLNATTSDAFEENSESTKFGKFWHTANSGPDV